jgi:hypothetical protein
MPLCDVGLRFSYDASLLVNGGLGRWDLTNQTKPFPVEILNEATFNSFGIEYVQEHNICVSHIEDPMSDIIAAFNELLLRSGVYLGLQSKDDRQAGSMYLVRQVVPTTDTTET